MTIIITYPDGTQIPVYSVDKVYFDTISNLLILYVDFSGYLYEGFTTFEVVRTSIFTQPD